MQEFFIDHLQTQQGVLHLQKFLGLIRFHADIGGNQICQPAGIINTFENLSNIRGNESTQSKDAFTLQSCRSEGGFYDVVFDALLFGNGLNLCPETVRLVFKVPHTGPADTLDQELDAVVWQLEHAQDIGNGTCGIEIFNLRIIHRFVFLRTNKDMMALSLQCLLHGSHGTLAADEERQDHVVEDDHIAYREHWQQAADFLKIFFSQETRLRILRVFACAVGIVVLRHHLRHFVAPLVALAYRQKNISQGRL